MIEDREILTAIANKIKDAINDPEAILEYDDTSGELAASALVVRPAIYAVQCVRAHIAVYDWRGSAPTEHPDDQDADGYHHLGGWNLIKKIPLSDPKCIKKAAEEAKRIKNED